MTLERKTPLKAGTKRLAPGKPLERKTAMPAAQRYRSLPSSPAKVRQHAGRVADGGRAARPARKPTRYTGFSDRTKVLIRNRDRGLCVRCGAAAADIDHRSGRGAGGRSRAEQERMDTPAWGLTLCGHGNTSGCHGWKESAPRPISEPAGYRISRNGPAVDAAHVPVLSVDGWALFADDGTRTPTTAPEETA